MTNKLLTFLHTELTNFQQAGLYKSFNVSNGPIRPRIEFISSKPLMQYCTGDYLGLANHPQVLQAAKKALDEFGFGNAGSRVLCGSQTIHQRLENELCTLLKQPNSILFNSTYEAYAGLFDSLFGAEDIIFYSDQASVAIHDGLRISSAKSIRFRTHDWEDLEFHLKRAKDCRFRVIMVESVSRYSGELLDLPLLYEMASLYDALLFVDDTLGCGVLGQKGLGILEHHNAFDKVDLVISSFENALGGVSCAFCAGKPQIVDWLKQRAKPLHYSNATAPSIVGGCLEALRIVINEPGILTTLKTNVDVLRNTLIEYQFKVLGNNHPNIFILLEDAVLTQKIVDALQTQGIYVVGFCYPSVPKGAARIRIQVTTGHTSHHLQNLADALHKSYNRLVKS